MYKLDFHKAATAGALLLALIALYVAISATSAPAPVVNVPVASTQSFSCAPGTMCVQYGGKVVDMLSGSTFNINSGAVFTVGSLTQ